MFIRKTRQLRDKTVSIGPGLMGRREAADGTGERRVDGTESANSAHDRHEIVHLREPVIATGNRQPVFTTVSLDP